MAVDRCRSFTAAARELGVSQPAISQNISELERTLAVQLFERSRTEVTLTDKGELFKQYAEQILHWYAAAEQAFGPDPDPLSQRVELEIGEGRRAELWGSQGDLHIKILD